MAVFLYRDYRPDLKLDNYEDVDIDDDVEDVAPEQRFQDRMAAEAAMDRREKLGERRYRNDIGAFDGDDAPPDRRRRVDQAQEGVPEEEEVTSPLCSSRLKTNLVLPGHAG
jgi:hypothetical protein